MADVTFIVPVAPHHEAQLERTIASIDAQTIPVRRVVIHDRERQGAGWARNQGIAQVNSRYLVFLDADDEVLPEFSERTVAVAQEQRFVYTDWYDEDVPFQAAACPWTANTRNVITTLVATRDAKAVGGFDERLQGMEDTHFYLKLLSAGICGLHVHEPLFRYRPGGQRSVAFYQSPGYHAAVQRFNTEFGSKPMTECGGCGGSPYAMPEIQNLPIGEPQSGDVLAEALWLGNKSERGRITGRLYPRASNGKQLWVAPRDIDAAPHLFARVVEMPGKPQESDFQRFARTAMHQMAGAPSQPEIIPVQHAVTKPVKPDVQTVLNLYTQTR